MDDKNIKEDDGLDIEIIDDFILDEPSQKLDSNAQSLEMKKAEIVSNNQNSQLIGPQNEQQRQNVNPPQPKPMPSQGQARPQEVHPMVNSQASPQPMPGNEPSLNPVPQPMPSQGQARSQEAHPMTNNQSRSQSIPNSESNFNSVSEPVVKYERNKELEFKPVSKMESVENIKEPEELVEKPSKKKKKSKVLIYTLLFIILIIAAVIVYYWQVSSPKRLLVKAVEEVSGNFGYFTLPLKNSSTRIDGNKTHTRNLTFNIEMNNLDESELFGLNNIYNDIISNVNKTTISYEYKKSLNDNKEFLNIYGNLNEDELFNVDFLKINNKSYFLLKDILDKYIEIENAEVANVIDIQETIENFEYLLSVVGKSMFKNIDNSYLNTEKVNVNLKNEEVVLKKITLNLNQDNQKKIYKNIFLDLKNDKKAIEIISKYNSKFKDMDIEEKLNQLSLDQDFLFSVYYKDMVNTIVMAEINNTTHNEKVVYTNTTEETIEFFNDTNTSLAKITIKKEQDDFIINATNSEGTIITITGEQQKDNYTYIFSKINENRTITAKAALKYETLIDGKEYNVNSNYVLKIAEKGQELFSLEVIENGKITNNAQIIDEDNETKVTSKLTKEETDQISEKLLSIGNKFLE